MLEKWPKRASLLGLLSTGADVRPIGRGGPRPAAALGLRRLPPRVPPGGETRPNRAAPDPPSVCHLQVLLRFWDLFVIRAVLYPLYIANAPHARFEALRCRPLPVFRLAFGVINGGLQLAELKTRAGAGR